MPTKEEAHSQISALAERFAEQLPSYKKSDYNETLLVFFRASFYNKTILCLLFLKSNLK
jgi:hypothetical protein